MDMDIEHLRGWIGREDKAQELLTEELVRRFRATLGLADTTTPPRLIHLCLAPPVVPNAATGPDGHPARGGFLPPIPLPNRMWAGGDFTFHGDPQVGELITRHSSIRDVVLKSGRSGPLCFVTVDHRISAGGRLLVEERQDIVYRAASPRAASPRAAPAEAAAPGACREDADGGPWSCSAIPRSPSTATASITIIPMPRRSKAIPVLSCMARCRRHGSITMPPACGAMCRPPGSASAAMPRCSIATGSP